jgi:arsenate reductase
MFKMFGINNCDTVKKAKNILEKKKINFEFVDFKKYPPTKNEIKKWSESLGELPVNKKGTTYRKFKDEFESLSESKKIDFLVVHSSMIKRPILEKNEEVVHIGFDHDVYEGL